MNADDDENYLDPEFVSAATSMERERRAWRRLNVGLILVIMTLTAYMAFAS